MSEATSEGLKLYTVSEAADVLRISLRSAYKFVEEGRLKAYKAEGTRQWLIPEESIKDFIGMK